MATDPIESPEDFAARLADEYGATGCFPEVSRAVHARDAAVRREALRDAQHKLAADGGVQPPPTLALDTPGERILWSIAILTCCQALFALAGGSDG